MSVVAKGGQTTVVISPGAQIIGSCEAPDMGAGN